MRSERDALIMLNRTPGIGPARMRALCQAFGGAAAVLAAPADALARVRGCGEKVAEAIRATADSFDVDRELARAKAADARIITQADDDYPAPLRELYDAPMCLYVRGVLQPSDTLALGIVGTRRASQYGLAQAERLAYGAAKAGFTIVSGLARGIDTAAHQGALKAGGRTLAVLGGALDRLYPPENRELADAIANGHGAIISEFSMGREPDRTTFPYRNRIISGLSKGVLVVEAGLSSGAMQTADHALEQGRSVFAVPGRVDLDAARGPHRLIKDGARLVEGVDDILKEFEFLFPKSVRDAALQAVDARQQVRLSPAETAVVRVLWTDPEVDQDLIVRRTGLSVGQLMVVAMQLELKRIIRRLPGRKLALVDEIRHWQIPGIADASDRRSAPSSSPTPNRPTPTPHERI